MNNKGFTLIELLATISILALIMAVAVPNVMNIIDKNKKATYVEDAKKMITLAEYKIRSDTSIALPEADHCVVILLRALDQSDLQKGPEGGSYDLDLSYVMIANKDNQYIYYASLVENYQSRTRGLTLLSRDDLLDEKAITKVKANDDLQTVEPTKYELLNGYYVDDVIFES